MQRIINWVLLVSFLFEAVTGIMLMFGWRSRLISIIHNYNGLAFIALALVHMIQNWNCIKSNFCKRRSCH